MPDYPRIFSNSLSRVEQEEAEKGELIDCFYDRFLASSAAIGEKFAKTDMEHQKQMLRDSFKLVLSFSTRRRSDEELEHIARRHGRADLDISPLLYGDWINSLVESVAQLDPEFDRNVSTAWRIVMAPGIEFMKGHYESDPD